jgi:hypothetical protein
MDWTFRDRKTGHIVVAQLPNLPLAIFLVATLVRVVAHPHGRVGDAVSLVGTVALVWWAVEEVAHGVNPFRRALGGLVLVATVIGLIGRIA